MNEKYETNDQFTTRASTQTETAIPMNDFILKKSNLRASWNDVIDFMFNGTHAYPPELMFKMGVVDAEMKAL